MTIFFQLPNQSTDVQKIILSKKEVIFDEAKFIFNPILEKKGDTLKLKFLIEITSYINADLLDFDFNEVIMLVFNDDAIESSQYEIIEKGAHRLIANITFNIEQFTPTTQFGLKVFTYSDNDVFWD